jgi:eukaryotic-like serine/threonine-protein kinase
MGVRPGTRLDGRYRLADRLANGGMGAVWRATDEVLNRHVAVKILHRELAEDEGFLHRLRAEARTTSGLPHNGIAAVYDYGETRVAANGQSPAPADDPDTDPVVYLVMELVPGAALSTILSRVGPLSGERTIDLIAQAARAVHAAHLRGMIHRDITPAHLMVTPPRRVKVTHFGIARPLDQERLTATGQVMGSAHYLAPELAKGHDVSPLSDVYALGVVAYECLAGRRPFEGDNQVAVALAHLNQPAPPLPPTVPAQLRAVVGAAMEKEPQRRIPSAEAFAAALETLRG